MTDSASEATGRIFISYRRQDSAYPAGWLYDRLTERFGSNQIFKDVDSIELGDDFVETITNAVGSCDILLALIGQEWLDIAGADGTRRLDDPDDFVRLEIEAALKRKVLLIPILVDGAIMPRGDQLPTSIAPMVRRQALELSPNRFRADTERLVDVMERTLVDLRDDQTDTTAPVTTATESKPDEPGAPRISRRVLIAAAATVAVIVAVVAIVLANRPDDTNDPNDAKGGTTDPTPSSAATEPPKLGGPDAPVVLAHRGGNEEFAWQTLPAFEHAASIGAAVEIDVRWTKDGRSVLLHDPTTTPGMECEGGSLTIAEENWSVLRDGCLSPAGASKDGKQYGMSTLDQAVSAVSKIPSARIYPEIKVKQTAKQVRQFVTILKVVRMTGRTVVTSALPKELGKINEEAKNDGVDDLRLMQFVSKRVPVANLVDDLWGVAVRFDVATKAYVKELQDANLQVMVYNINTEDQWAEADRVGADIVMTDEPAGFGKWFEAR